MTKGAASNFSFIEPMKALRVRDLPSGDWLYEMKFDGYGALAFKAGKEVRLLSRNRTIFNDDYPQLVEALKLLAAKNVIIDGEIAAIQNPLVYYAFDLLFSDGTDLRSPADGGGGGVPEAPTAFEAD